MKNSAKRRGRRKKSEGVTVIGCRCLSLVADAVVDVDVFIAHEQLYSTRPADQNEMILILNVHEE